jgi:hypothetical protein
MSVESMESTRDPLAILNVDAPLLNTTSWGGFYGDTGNLSTPWLFHDYSPLHLDIAQAFMDGLLTLSSPFTIVLIVLYSLVFVVGLVGNAMVIWVIVRYRNMRTVTNMFFVNLSVGDLLVVVVCMPFTLAPYVYKVSPAPFPRPSPLRRIQFSATFLPAFLLFSSCACHLPFPTPSSDLLPSPPPLFIGTVSLPPFSQQVQSE